MFNLSIYLENSRGFWRFSGIWGILGENPGFWGIWAKSGSRTPGTPRDPPRTPDFPGFPPNSGISGPPGTPPGTPPGDPPGPPGDPPGDPPGSPRPRARGTQIRDLGARIRGPESATLAPILGVFRGAAALLINVFFGQVLVCFLCAARCGNSGPRGGFSGGSRNPGSGGVPDLGRIPR